MTMKTHGIGVAAMALLAAIGCSAAANNDEDARASAQTAAGTSAPRVDAPPAAEPEAAPPGFRVRTASDPKPPRVAAPTACAAYNPTYAGTTAADSLMTHPKVQFLYWGTMPNIGSVSLDRYLDPIYRRLVENPSFYAGIAEYSVTNNAFGTGRWLGSEVVASAPPTLVGDAGVGNLVAESDIRALVQNEIEAGRVASNDPQTLYVVVLGTGVKSQNDVDAKDNAHHWWFKSTGATTNGEAIRYAVIPFDLLSFPVAAGPQAVLHAGITHEIWEAFTDPTGSGWKPEIGDACEDVSKFLAVDGVPTLGYWSNATCSCAAGKSWDSLGPWVQGGSGNASRNQSYALVNNPMRGSLLDLFVLSSAHDIWWRHANGSGIWTPYTAMPGGGQLTKIAAAAYGGTEVVFGIGMDGNVWRNAQTAVDAWSFWQMLPAKTVTELAVAVDGAGEAHLFAIGADGKIWTIQTVSDMFGSHRWPSSWTAVADDGSIANPTAIAPIRHADGRLEIAAVVDGVSTDWRFPVFGQRIVKASSVKHTSFIGGSYLTWNPWKTVRGAFGNIAQLEPTRLGGKVALLSVGDDERVYAQSATDDANMDAAWTSARALGFGTPIRRIAAAVDTYGVTMAFGYDDFGEVSYMYAPPGSTWLGPIQRGAAVQQLGVGVHADGLLELFGVDASNALRHDWEIWDAAQFDTSAWRFGNTD